MTRPLRFGLFVSFVALLSGACGPAWPAVTASADPSFATGRRPVRTIDVLPIDVQIWSRPDKNPTPAAIAESFDGEVAGALPGLLARRGYQVVANLDWRGEYVSARGARRQALSPEEIAETAYALSGYGVAVSRSGDPGLVPFLPARLGARTGSDATLYIGGWAYAGKNPSSTGKKVLIGVGIVLFIAVIAVVVVAAAKSHGGGGGLGKLGGAAKGVARAGGHVARVAGRVVGGVGRVALHVGRGAGRAMAEVARGVDHIEFHAGDPDCFGRSSTHLDWYPGRPDYYRQPGARHSGRSASMIEMTLIDNRSGLVLWHARQRFPASPEKPGQVRRVLESMVAAIPAA